MNDLINMPEEVNNYLSRQLEYLYHSYGQVYESETMKKDLEILNKELKRKRVLNKNMLDKTYKEILHNFVTYRKMCIATYMTAFAKMNHK